MVFHNFNGILPIGSRFHFIPLLLKKHNMRPKQIHFIIHP